MSSLRIERIDPDEIRNSPSIAEGQWMGRISRQMPAGVHEVALMTPYWTGRIRASTLLIMTALKDRHEDKIQGVLSCFDRVVVQGNLSGIGYADGMTSYLYAHGIRIFEFPKFAHPLREQIRDNAYKIAKQAGISITPASTLEGMRKEQWVQKCLKERGESSGLVCILSAMEACTKYKPWHDKKTGRTFLKHGRGKCTHYYFYFIDEQFGLCYMRVPTWCPVRLQVYFNGHNWLACKLRAAGIGYQMLDNAFFGIDDFDRAQSLADEFSIIALTQMLNRQARRFCPVVADLDLAYQWTVMQVEYCTDLVFRRQEDLATLYEHVVRTAVHTVKAENVATFLGRKLHPNYRDEVGNALGRRVRGTRIKHSMGPASLEMYDKRGIVLRSETTCNDVSFFRHYRTVIHHNGEHSATVAPMRKAIYNLAVELPRIMGACNRRYLQFVSSLEEPTVNTNDLDKLTASVKRDGRTYRGFHFFLAEERSLFEVLLGGEFNLGGLRNRDLRLRLPKLSPGQVSHRIKRLRVHGVLKKVARSYKYHLTTFGRRVLATALRLRQTLVLPLLAESTGRE